MSEPITTKNTITEGIHCEVDNSKIIKDMDVKPAVIVDDKNAEAKSYDPNELDSVVNVVTDADPIEKICRDAGMIDPAKTSEVQSKNHVENGKVQSKNHVENGKVQSKNPANPKKVARKRHASNLLTLICVISMLAVVIVFAQSVELAHLDLGDMYGKLIAACTGASVLFHMWAHGYIIRTIE